MQGPLLHSATPKPVPVGNKLSCLCHAAWRMSAQFREILLYRQAIMAGLQTWNVNTGDNSDVFMQQEYMFLVFPKCMNFIISFYARSHMEYKPATIEALEAHMASLGFLYGWMYVSGTQKYEWRVYTEQCHHEYGFPA